MKTVRSKLFEFSHAFYNQSIGETFSVTNKNSTFEVNERILGPTTSKTIKIFHESNVENQRVLLDRNSKSIIYSLLEAVFLLESEENSLIYLLPYLDAIILCSLIR